MQTEKKHTAIYLPPDLLRRLAEYQLRITGSPYGRNRIVIEAIEAFLKKKDKH
jgi:hypothetical protein